MPSLNSGIILLFLKRNFKSCSSYFVHVPKLQAEYKNQFEQEKVEAKFNTLTNKAMLDEVEKEILKKAKGKGKDKTVNPDDMMKLKADYMELTQDVEDEPTRRLFKTNETSVQSMTVLQNENPRGVLVFRDELTGLLAKWDREDGETERSYYLEGWNGSGCYTDSKIGRGLTDAENVCISLLGGLQPDKLRRYLYQAIRGGNDGMMQRLQLAVWPDEPKKWKNVDVYPDKEAKKLAYDIFLKLADMDLPSMEQYKESMTSGLIIDSARLHKAFLMITWKNYMLSNLSRKKTRLCLNTLVNFGHLCQVLP